MQPQTELQLSTSPKNKQRPGKKKRKNKHRKVVCALANTPEIPAYPVFSSALFILFEFDMVRYDLVSELLSAHIV